MNNNLKELTNLLEDADKITKELKNIIKKIKVSQVKDINIKVNNEKMLERHITELKKDLKKEGFERNSVLSKQLERITRVSINNQYEIREIKEQLNCCNSSADDKTKKQAIGKLMSETD